MSIMTQNVGRLLRGEEDKTAVLILLNADPELIRAIAQSPAVIEGSEMPPVVVTGKDPVQLVDQARRWLEADGGEWPAADPDRKNPKKKGRKPRSRESVLAAVDAAIERGMSWRDFRQKCNPQRHLSPEELEQARQRFLGQLSVVKIPLV
jgi:hypothetical protein